MLIEAGGPVPSFGDGGLGDGSFGDDLSSAAIRRGLRPASTICDEAEGESVLSDDGSWRPTLGDSSATSYRRMADARLATPTRMAERPARRRLGAAVRRRSLGGATARASDTKHSSAARRSTRPGLNSYGS